MFVGYLILAVLGYAFFEKRSKDILNPFAVSVSIWFLGAAISQLRLSELLANWCWMTHIVVLTFGFVIAVCGLLFTRGVRTSSISKSCDYGISKEFKLLMWIMIGVSFSCALLEWYKNDFYLPLLQSALSDKKNAITAIPVIHYGTNCLPYCALVSLYRIFFDKKCFKPVHFFVIAFVIFYILFIQVSRGTLLVFILGSLPLIQERYHLKIYHFVSIGIGIVLFLLFFMVIRTPNKSSLVYIASCYDNLNTLIQEGSPYSICYVTLLKPILEVANINIDIPYIEYNIAFFNAKTILYGFYHDLGVMGVVMYSFLIFLMVALVYQRSKRKKIYLLLIAALQKSIFVMFFGNYFTGTFINMFPIILIWLIIVFTKKKVVYFNEGHVTKYAQ